MAGMKKQILQTTRPDIDSLIVEVRGQKALLDADLARLYGVETRALNQAVKRNSDRFPSDFAWN
jgi:ORF6N domain-containing protein